MYNMFSAPYKGCYKSHVSQGWKPGEHPALDIVKYDGKQGMGEPLTAPEDVLILKLSGDNHTTGTKALENGFGVYMKGLETGLIHLYWHTYPAFPVKVGDTVKRGKIVGFMSNSGYVTKGGKYVPIETRHFSNDGTHLHWEVMDKTYVIGKKKPLINFSDMIDWYSQPTYNILEKQVAILKTIVRGYQLLQK